MSEAAGHAPDRLHLLRVQQLLLGALAGRDLGLQLQVRERKLAAATGGRLQAVAQRAGAAVDHHGDHQEDHGADAGIDQQVGGGVTFLPRFCPGAQEHGQREHQIHRPQRATPDRHPGHEQPHHLDRLLVHLGAEAARGVGEQHARRDHRQQLADGPLVSPQPHKVEARQRDCDDHHARRQARAFARPPRNVGAEDPVQPGQARRRSQHEQDDLQHRRVAPVDRILDRRAAQPGSDMSHPTHAYWHTGSTDPCPDASRPAGHGLVQRPARAADVRRGLRPPRPGPRRRAPRRRSARSCRHRCRR